MCRFVLFIPTLLLSVFVFSQKKNDKPSLEKTEAMLQADMQKNIDALFYKNLKDNELTTANYIARTYKAIGLSLFIDSSKFLQPFTSDLGKEIKPATSLKINGVLLEPSTDYWPFSFCPNGFFAGTAVWGAMESDQPFLYDLKPTLEKNNEIPTLALLKNIKEKTAELAEKKIPAIIVYNSSEINDSLAFYANDTTQLTTIPVIYFTKSGIQKLKNESTIANAIDAEIVVGKKIVDGTNVIGYINNGATNTVIIAASNNNEFGTATIFELAKLLKEICMPVKTNTTGLNVENYNNNNYLFANFSGLPPDNFGNNYFLNHLPFDISKINYALNIGVNGAPTDTTGFLSVNETISSTLWEDILQKSNPSYILKKDNSLVYNLNSTPFYKRNIPNLFLFNPDFETTQKNQSIIINKNDIKTIHFIMQLIGNANKYGKLPFNKNE